MGTVVENIGTGGYYPVGIRDILQCGGPGSTYLGIGDVWDNPL